MERRTAQPRRHPAMEPSAGAAWADEATHWDRDQVVPPPTHPPKQRRGVAWELTLALLALAIIVAGVATLLIMELWLIDRVMPGVYVWDVDLGGMTRDEAMEQLQTNFDYPADRLPTLHYSELVWPVDLTSLGGQLDAEATVDTALSVGHRGDPITRIEEQFDVLANGVLVMPTFAFDPGTGGVFLSQVAGQVNRPLRNATLSLGNDLSVAIIPSQVGLVVDEEATRQALAQRISSMTGGDVELIVKESEPLLTDLEAAQAQVQRVLSAPITLTAPDHEPWIIEPQTLASWLILRPATSDDGSTTLAVSLDPGHTTRYAEDIARQVTWQPTNAQFRWDDASGTIVPVIASVPGQTLDVTATVALITNASTGDQRSVPLPLTPIRPAIASEDAPNLGIVELIGEGITRFSGSSRSRVQNIIVGAAQFDGLLIAPGETFSFNHYLGEVTAEKGYEESIIIWGNTTRADVGGGLCQVSSTAFRAAFWAGVPIVERWPHAFRVSYYEPPIGMDATIYSPSVDLKWVNDTGHYMLIHTYVDQANNTLTFRYYGTNPGRTVEMDGPHESNPVPHGPPVYREDPTLPKGQTRQIEWAKDGLDVTVYRIIKENGVEVQRDTIFSRFQPWQAVYLVGIKE